MSAPRSVRNLNPGNLRIGQPWIGLATPEAMTPDQLKETSFCVFISPIYGFRALALTLLTYQRKYKLRTIFSLISRFAPANENDTRAYVAHVSAALNVLQNQPVNLEDFGTLAELCRAIAIHEAGAWLFDTQDLNAGVSMALGMEPTPAPDDNDTGPLVA